MGAYAKINASQNVLGVFDTGIIDTVLIQELEEGESFVPISQSEAEAFYLVQNASFVDGVFVPGDPFVPPVGDIFSLDEQKNVQIRQLGKDMNTFIQYASDGTDRYPVETQAAFNRICLRCEQVLRINVDSPTGALAAASATQTALNSVDDWIRSIIAEYYDIRADILAATTVPELYAITWDFSSFDATDPEVSLLDIL